MTRIRRRPRWRLLVGALAVAIVSASFGAGSAQAQHISPERWFPDNIVYGDNVYGNSHLHRLWESSARAVTTGRICAGAIQNGPTILQPERCSWDLSIQPLNGESWRQAIFLPTNVYSMWARAQVQFGDR